MNTTSPVFLRKFLRRARLKLILPAAALALHSFCACAATVPKLIIRAENNGTLVVLTYVRPYCPASTVTLEMSADLLNWGAVEPWLTGPPEVTPNPDGVSETIVYRGSASPLARFFRARIVSDPPIVDFFSDPAALTTNLGVYLVTGIVKTGQEAWINGVHVGAGGIDEAGNFSVPVALPVGFNLLEVVVRSTATGEPLRSASKMIRFDPAFSTAGKRLLYLSCVPGGGDSPAVNGTVVIDLDADTILGILPNLHIRGISPDGAEIYLHDSTVLSTAFHQPLRTLPFSDLISPTAFLVAPDGQHLFSGTEIVNVPGNQLLGTHLPVNIASGSSWADYSIPGGPTISPDSRWIFCNNNLNRVDWQTGEVIGTGLYGSFYSDALVAGARNLLLISEYSYGSGQVKIYDATTFATRAIVGGLGDFAGQLALLDDRYCVVGASGNAAFRNGAINVIDLETFSLVARAVGPLADNVAVDRGVREIFAAAGISYGDCPRIGVDVFRFSPSGLSRLKTFHLGINRSVSAVGAPQFDGIRRIVFKAATP